MISYAQNFEDVMLWRALGHVRGGFYVDIGAQDPLVDSVSLTFYENGWRGVHVEPAPMYAQALRAARPDEAVLQMAVGGGGGLIPFFEIPNSGISTGDPEIAKRHETAGYPNRRIEVPCIRLCDLLDRYADRNIHWMKIDVEGMERSVLESWAPSPVRPWVLAIEAMIPFSRESSHAEWEDTVVSLGYRLCYFDGLNRYYVADGHPELVKAFEVPPNVFDDFALSGKASHRLCTRLNQIIEQSFQDAARLRTRQAELEASLVSPSRDVAAQAMLIDLQRRVTERSKHAEQGLQEAVAQSRQVALTLAHLQSAKSETLQLLKALNANDRAHIARGDAARDEVARLRRKLADRDSFVKELHLQHEARLQDGLAEQRAGFDARFARAEADLQQAHVARDAQLAKCQQLEEALPQRLAEREGVLNAEHAAQRAADRQQLEADFERRAADRQSVLNAEHTAQRAADRKQLETDFELRMADREGVLNAEHAAQRAADRQQLQAALERRMVDREDMRKAEDVAQRAADRRQLEDDFRQQLAERERVLNLELGALRMADKQQQEANCQQRLAEREQVRDAEHGAQRASDRQTFERELRSRQHAFHVANAAASTQLNTLQSSHAGVEADLHKTREDAARFRLQLSQQLADADSKLQALQRSVAGRALKFFGWTAPPLPTIEPPTAFVQPASSGGRVDERDE